MQATLQVGERATTIEYELAPQMVVFSHGFGVRRDARGLFTDIIAGLPKGWGYILFDYDSYDEVSRQQRAVGAGERLETLQAVFTWAAEQKGVEQLHAVGHSMGSLTLACLAPQTIGQIVLMAPPLKMGARFVELYNKRPGTRHDGHTWTIERSDGSFTVVDDDDLAELVSVDAEGELVKLAMFRPYTIVLAESDQIIPDDDYTDLIVMPSVSMQGINQADHDFNGRVRAELVQVIVSLLQGKAVDPID